MAKINDRIISLRKEKGMNQKQLAEALNISPSTIGMIEQGRRNPGYDLLEDISDFFNVDMDYLTGRSDIKNKYQLGIPYDWENNHNNEEIEITLKINYDVFKSLDIISKNNSRTINEEILYIIHNYLGRQG